MKLTAAALSITLHAAASEGKIFSGGGARGNGKGGGRGIGKGFSKAENRARVIDFWTGNDKFNLKHAKPRDLALDAPLDIGNDKGKGGGGKGKGKRGNLKGTGKGGVRNGGRSLQDLVDDAPWTNGGDVLMAAGRIMFRMGGSLYVCSGTAVKDENTPGRSIILTAAHCVHDEADVRAAMPGESFVVS